MKKGFTLIELLVVIAIIGILVTMVAAVKTKMGQPDYVPFLSAEERIASEMHRANDLKEKELEILRYRNQAEKNP